MVRSHHERWDGTGYPDNLMESAIPLVARILCIADVYDAMTTQRSYQMPHSKADALAFMASQAGRMFDPELLQIFLVLMQDEQTAPVPAHREGYQAFLNRK
jgi:HD-GYP domain-containing protein (c-di-GMP phosphodiesterase class II)